jgi:cytochrome c oxidase cbb3-type subunit III
VLCASLMACALTLPAAQDRGSSRQSFGEGKRIFVSSCSMCHGMDGRGGEHAPDIATNSGVRRLANTALFEIVQSGIPKGGMPSFRSLGPDRVKAVIEYLRTLQGTHVNPVVSGNAAHGRELFFGSARCSSCHMMHGRGGFLGKDLSDYSLTHSAPQIRDAILDPNKGLNPDEGTVIAITRAGRKFIGVARNEDNFSLQLQTPDGAFHLLSKSGLAVVRHEPRSLMPSDYGSRLSPGDLNDLVSFLVKASGGGKTTAIRPAGERHGLSRQFPESRNHSGENL